MQKGEHEGYGERGDKRKLKKEKTEGFFSRFLIFIHSACPSELVNAAQGASFGKRRAD